MTSAAFRRPLVGVITDVKMVGIHPFHMVGEKYMAALAYGADVLPVALPPLQAGLDSPDDTPFYDIDEILGRFDGLFLPGSASNMEPWRYGAAVRDGDPSVRDPQRDATSLRLLNAALDGGLPLFCVCRGYQELNVALGGSLYQQVHEVPGMLDHRADASKTRAEQYAPAHDITMADNGRLRALAGRDRASVNSIHEQGIDRLADRLVAEAWAPDGLIEAVSVADAPGYALGVQWHPEWRFWEDDLSRRLFKAFGDEVYRYAAARGTIDNQPVAANG